MNFYRYFFTSIMTLFMVSLSTGCSLFSSEEDTIQVSPSPVIETQLAINQIWSNSLSGEAKIYALLSPTYLDNIVYAADRNGRIKAIDFSNGKTLWDKSVAKSSLFSSQSALLSGGVSVDNKQVYVGSERAKLFALDKTNGTVNWSVDAKGEVLAKPISSEEKVVIHTSNGHLQALNRDTGEEIWNTDMNVPLLSLRGQSTPTTAYGAIIVGDDNGHVNAYFLNDGQLIWQQRISQPSGSTEIAKLNDVDSTPVIEKNLAYAVGYNGNLVALDLSNGQIIWRKPLGSTHGLIVDNAHIFAIDQNDNLVAVSKNDGLVIWQQSGLLHRQLTDPVLYKDYIVVGDFEGFLYWIDKNNGDIVSKIEVSSSGLRTKPLIIDNTIVIQAKNGTVYAYR